MVSSENLPLRLLLDTAPDGFIVTDEKGVIVWANQKAHEMFGYRDIELLGYPVEALIPERLREGHVLHRKGYQESSRMRPMGLGLNLQALRKDGTEFPVEISLSPFHTRDGVLITAAVRDVTERRRLEDERALLRSELETERERDRIAMDLHDGIMQDVYAAALSLELALIDSDQPGYATSATVEKAIDQLHDVVRNIRSYIFDLRPREFIGTLAEGLQNLAQEFRQNSQIATEAIVDAEVGLDMQTSMALYHIAHECLSNIQKHAKAETVTLKLSFDEAFGHLEIKDDGVGFDTRVARGQQHRGLRNITNRAMSIKGRVHFESAPGQGTAIEVRFPRP